MNANYILIGAEMRSIVTLPIFFSLCYVYKSKYSLHFPQRLANFCVVSMCVVVNFSM